MARFPFLHTPWPTGLIMMFLALLGTTIPAVFANTLPPGTIQGTNAAGEDQILYIDRNPALYTGDFGDCMGGASLLNLTSFDAAYYADNLTVLFDIAGTTNLGNEAVVCECLLYLLHALENLLIITSIYFGTSM